MTGDRRMSYCALLLRMSNKGYRHGTTTAGETQGGDADVRVARHVRPAALAGVGCVTSVARAGSGAARWGGIGRRGDRRHDAARTGILRRRESGIRRE